MSKLIKNAISKNLIIFKIFLKKIIELFLSYWIFDFRATLLLISLLKYCFVKKQNSKQNFICSINLSSFKIIFILLAKIIAI